MSTNSPYRYRYAAVAPRSQPAPLLRIAAIVGAVLTVAVVIAVLVYGVQLARAPRPVAQPTPAAQAVKPAALSPAAVANARRLLATWHTVHIPLGVVMFTVAFVHIAAALYFATFLH